VKVTINVTTGIGGVLVAIAAVGTAYLAWESASYAVRMAHFLRETARLITFWTQDHA